MSTKCTGFCHSRNCGRPMAKISSVLWYPLSKGSQFLAFLRGGEMLKRKPFLYDATGIHFFRASDGDSIIRAWHRKWTYPVPVNDISVGLVSPWMPSAQRKQESCHCVLLPCTGWLRGQKSKPGVGCVFGKSKGCEGPLINIQLWCTASENEGDEDFFQWLKCTNPQEEFHCPVSEWHTLPMACFGVNPRIDQATSQQPKPCKG